MIGNKLAHYSITGKLGEGGMGVVYEARDSHLDRAVAIKVLPRDAVANTARKQRFVQEAKAASALNHPNIVTIYDIACDDGVDYMAMELIRGRTVEQMLSRGKLRLGDALKYGVQIADALAAAHAAGIVHRDLKPGNVMITDRGDVKVLDFGLAKLTDDPDISEDDATRTQAVTDQGTVVGSAPYMSPEQAEGRKVDARSDIFSFGSLLYEMLTGKRAFTGTSRTATMAAILNREPEPLTTLVPEIPREVERVVTRCLRKDLDRRSQSMAETRIALQELKEEAESGSLSAATAPVSAARKPVRWPYYVAGGLAAVSAIAAGWFFLANRPAPALHATVLTSFVGVHSAPSLSPDGNQFAFMWNGDGPTTRPHLYISLVGNGTPLRLTPENEGAAVPSWSPDGKLIAFYKGSRTETTLLVMSALGGPVRKIAQGLMLDAPAWSPDGKWLLWTQHTDAFRYSLYIVPAGGGVVRTLLDPPANSAGDTDPAISPDGRQLVFSRIMGDKDYDLYVAAFHDGRITGTPRQLTHNHEIAWNPLWTHDGKEIIYIAGEPTSELAIYRVPISGGPSRRIEGIGTNATYLTLAARSNRLLYSTQTTNYDIHRLDLTAHDAKPQRFLSSTRFENEPAYSPDGKRIVFSSNRGGVRQIWIADADASNAVPLTSFASGVAGSPKWSPDGQAIAFDARPEGTADIYTVPATGGPVKRVTDFPGEDHVPSWSPDGKWIYFGSRRAGGHELFRMRPDGSGVQQMTHNGGEFGEVSPDGKWLYYSVPSKGLWKMPADGGQATQFLPREALNGTLSFMVGSQGICAVGARQPNGFPIALYPFDGGKPRTLVTPSRPAFLFPAISPDGRYLLYSSADDPVYEIMLVDNFK